MDKTPNNSTTRVFFSRIRRKFLSHVWLARTVFFVGIILAVFLSYLLVGKLFERVGIPNFVQLASDFVFTPPSKIKAIDDRTNILILGKSGPGHAGSELTDTIILASFSHSGGPLTLISLPRDIWVPEIRAKLNSAYYWGNQKQPVLPSGGPGGGFVLAKSTVEKITGVPVQYGAVVDFSAFKKVIDVIGGIEIDVEREFIDNKYPIAGRENDECGGDPEFKCRYETLHFDRGKQMMDGETALKFVRSRNAEGDEGTDLAREARQQKVLDAVKEKVMSPNIILDPRKVLNIWNVISSSIETDIDNPAFAILARRLVQSGKNMKSYVIPENFLFNPPISPRFDNQYVFIPNTKTLPSGETGWGEVQAWVKSILK